MSLQNKVRALKNSAVSYYIAEERLQSKTPKVSTGQEFDWIHKILEGKGALDTQTNVFKEPLVANSSDELSGRMKIALITLGEAAYGEMLYKYQTKAGKEDYKIKIQEESLQV